jgi:phosphopantetheine adenylyltransferase
LQYFHIFPYFLFYATFSVVQGYIWRFAKREGASLFFRGIRSWDQDGRDEQALQILNTWGPMLLGPLVWPVPTFYMEGNPKYNHVSSTLIRDICEDGNPADDALSELVPTDIAGTVAELYSAKQG